MNTNDPTSFISLIFFGGLAWMLGAHVLILAAWSYGPSNRQLTIQMIVWLLIVVAYETAVRFGKLPQL